MVLAGEDFYVSAGFWVAVVAAVLAGVAIWATLRVAYPRRRLLYAMPVATPLLNAEEGVSGIEVRRGDRVLTDPHVLQVTLVNQGRRDIPTTAFDQNQPLVLDVDAPIVEILKRTTSSGHALPKVVVDGTALRIGPGLIARRQKISFSLLVDGTAPTLTCPPPHPIDIDVRHSAPSPSSPRTTLVYAASAVVASAVVNMVTKSWEPAAWLLVLVVLMVAATAVSAISWWWRKSAQS